MKRRIIMALAVSILILMGIGITYSIFTSSGKLTTNDQNIAKFIFNANESNNIELPLIDLKPGEKTEYLFSVGNNENGKISEVTIEYQIIIKTYHFMPFVIKLYKINTNNEEFIFECNESSSRNVVNELVCNVPVQKMEYSYAKTDNYKLEVEFPSEYNNVEYSELIDYIVLEIKSWQK